MNMVIYDCEKCGYIYDTNAGDSKNGVPKNTSLEQLEHTLCHECGMQPCRRKIRKVKEYSGLEVKAYPFFCGKTSPFVYTDQPKNIKLLDVGAGTGRIGSAFSKCAHNEITFLENSPEMIHKLEYAQKFIKNSRILSEDILTVQLEKEYYDLIIVADGFLQHFIQQDEQLLIMEKLLASLKNTGKLCVECFVLNQTNVSERKNKEYIEGHAYYMDSYAQLNLLEKTIATEIQIEKVVRDEVEQKMRIQRELALILPQDMKNMLTMLNVRKNHSVAYNIQMERFDHLGGGIRPFQQQTVVAAETIQYDWIQCGYPFSNNNSHQVQWVRYFITKCPS